MGLVAMEALGGGASADVSALGAMPELRDVCAQLPPVRSSDGRARRSPFAVGAVAVWRRRRRRQRCAARHAEHDGAQQSIR